MKPRSQVTNATILLIDNGSTRAEATVQLRQLATKISNQTGNTIHAVSLNHSDRITANAVKNKLDNIPARIFVEFMAEQLTTGQRDFILIPLFFGNSRALTSFVPDEKKRLEEQFGPFSLNMTKVLYPLPDGDPLIVEILYQHAITTAGKNTEAALKNLVLVDHGSPLPAVNAVRQHIAAALNSKLAKDTSIAQAAMERRKGKKYDFNGELLEDYLSELAESGETQATILLMFLLAGKHAGENGDIINICNSVMKQYPDFKVAISPLLSHNENIVTCLTQRLQQFLNQ